MRPSCVLLLLIGLVAASVSAADWLCERGDPSHTSFVDAPSLAPATWSAVGPFAITDVPAVSSTRLFVLKGVTPMSLVALDLESGKEVWSTPLSLLVSGWDSPMALMVGNRVAVVGLTRNDTTAVYILQDVEGSAAPTAQSVQLKSPEGSMGRFTVAVNPSNNNLVVISGPMVFMVDFPSDGSTPTVLDTIDLSGMPDGDAVMFERAIVSPDSVLYAIGSDGMTSETVAVDLKTKKFLWASSGSEFATVNAYSPVPKATPTFPSYFFQASQNSEGSVVHQRNPLTGEVVRKRPYNAGTSVNDLVVDPSFAWSATVVQVDQNNTRFNYLFGYDGIFNDMFHFEVVNGSIAIAAVPKATSLDRNNPVGHLTALVSYWDPNKESEIWSITTPGGERVKTAAIGGLITDWARWVIQVGPNVLYQTNGEIFSVGVKA